MPLRQPHMEKPSPINYSYAHVQYGSNADVGLNEMFKGTMPSCSMGWVINVITDKGDGPTDGVGGGDDACIIGLVMGNLPLFTLQEIGGTKGSLKG